MQKRDTIKVFAASRTKKFGEGAENFGDNLMGILLPELFGVDVKYSDYNDAELIGVGSIIDAYFRKKKGRSISVFSKKPWRTLHVWGAGFMHSASEATWPQKLEFHAVRGPLTAHRINQPEIPVGDPALFLPTIWPANAPKEFKVGVIPHFATLQTFDQKYGSSLPRHWQIINLLDDPKEVCSDIAKCDTIISSSLHGLIVADAYNIPSIWMHPETPIKGDGYKFRDYEAQRGVPFEKPILFSTILENDIKQSFMTVAPPDPKILDNLFSAFPFR